ncbi:hypothetical protein R1flu_007730 [Riccia fluitans]|uniref:Ferritin n=1 Tax=Riccia fluitans TaxID=41844 RepID=A0ABD1YZS2_9MARC
MAVQASVITNIPVACLADGGVLRSVDREGFSTGSPIMREGESKKLRLFQQPCRPSAVRKRVIPYATPEATAFFEPFKELEQREELLRLPREPHQSLARLRFEGSSESALNNQINVLYNLSYVYHSLFAYFDRDDVALLGFASYFKEESDRRRERAQELMEYQTVRGGRVQLHALVQPEVLDFEQVRKTLALAESLEKLSTEKFYALHQAAEEAQDRHLGHMIRKHYLAEQIEIVKRLSEYVAQLGLIGDQDGHGIYYFDRVLGTEGI